MKDITGEIFGRLKVIGFSHMAPGRKSVWECLCEKCGVVTKVRRHHLISGNTLSCGCLHAEKFTNYRHGHAKTGKASPEYRSWQAMWKRCTSPSHEAYENYGGRGIKVCVRWKKFENFIHDMGKKPSPLYTLDRYPNNDGNYEPENCRWATRSMQNSNQRKRRWKKKPTDPSG